jgi:hypothetical protein
MPLAHTENPKHTCEQRESNKNAQMPAEAEGAVKVQSAIHNVKTNPASAGLCLPTCVKSTLTSPKVYLTLCGVLVSKPVYLNNKVVPDPLKRTLSKTYPGSCHISANLYCRAGLGTNASTQMRCMPQGELGCCTVSDEYGLHSSLMCLAQDVHGELNSSIAGPGEEYNQ